MVARAGQHAVPGAQPAELGRALRARRGQPVHEVAGQNHHIRSLGVDPVHHGPDPVLAQQRAHMQIADLRQPEAVQGFGQPGQDDFPLADLGDGHGFVNPVSRGSQNQPGQRGAAQNGSRSGGQARSQKTPSADGKSRALPFVPPQRAPHQAHEPDAQAENIPDQHQHEKKKQAGEQPALEHQHPRRPIGRGPSPEQEPVQKMLLRSEKKRDCRCGLTRAAQARRQHQPEKKIQKKKCGRQIEHHNAASSAGAGSEVD